VGCAEAARNALLMRPGTEGVEQTQRHGQGLLAQKWAWELE
jgi:hypothetical protein